MTGQDWRHRSACLGMDGELFFPIGQGPALAREVEQAKRVCGRCPVAIECLQWSIETVQQHGIWGGMTEQEREPLLRRSRPPVSQAEQCEGCSGPLAGKQLRYCSDDCSRAARKRREAAARQERKAGAA